MKREGEKTYRSIGEIAQAAGVSPQTLRNWERKGLVIPVRSKGGQRLYDEDDYRRVRQIADLRRRHGWNAAAIRSSGALSATPRPPVASESPLGNRVRALRLSRGLTVQDVARKTGLSESFLAGLERGESGASVLNIARLADAFDVPQSAFSTGPEDSDRYVVRAAQRRRNVFAGGVTYEELASLGHSMEPALLTAPEGGGSGGFLSRSHESFMFVLDGWFEVRLVTPSGDEETSLLGAGDSIMLPAETSWSWKNPSDLVSQAVFVEMLGNEGGRRPKP
jgi:DNA-binding transcriptional MerR regulator